MILIWKSIDGTFIHNMLLGKFLVSEIILKGSLCRLYECQEKGSIQISPTFANIAEKMFLAYLDSSGRHEMNDHEDYVLASLIIN
jgi:hypothetical protein